MTGAQKSHEYELTDAQKKKTFACLYTSRYVPLRGWQAQMLSILAGMNQKDCFALYTVVHTPVVCNGQVPWLRGAENCEFSAVAAHLQGRRLPCRAAEAHPHDQAVQQTVVILLLPYTRWSVSLFTGRADFLRGAEANSPWSRLSVDHRDFPVAFHSDRCTYFAGRTYFSGSGVEVLAEIPQLQLVEKLCDPRGAWRSCSPRPLRVWRTARQVQFLSASNCGGPQLQLIVFLMRLIGPCAQA